MAGTTKKTHIEAIKEFCMNCGIVEGLILEDGKFGGSLDLRGTGITALPEGLTVGGSLDLSDTGITALPEGLTVGGDLYRDDTCKGTPKSIREGFVFMWQGGKYILADGIFSEVQGHRKHVYKIRQIGSKRIEFLVTDGNGRWAHGEDLKKARADLIYKIGSRDTSKYKGLAVDSTLTLREAIEAYRVITGACAAGTRGFVESITPKKKYTIAEIITLTKGRFGNLEFAEFFAQNV